MNGKSYVDDDIPIITDPAAVRHILGLHERLEKAHKEIERLRAALGKLRAEHRTCDHECTCAMISRIITQGTRCDCGADETNAIIDEALGI